MTIALAFSNHRNRRRAVDFRSLRTAVLALLLTGLLLGCGGRREPPPEPPPPPPPPTTEIRLILAASSEVNPDPTGRPSPIAVRVLRLSGTRAFNEADFFQLDRDPAASLGRELIGEETRFVLNPGDVRLVERELEPEERFIGVVAAYRDVAGSNWRAAVAVPRDRTTTLSALLDRGGVRLVAAEN
jgi:type VI secretion system protein VasD